jgi:hypothetical protein
MPSFGDQIGITPSGVTVFSIIVAKGSHISII